MLDTVESLRMEIFGKSQPVYICSMVLLAIGVDFTLSLSEEARKLKDIAWHVDRHSSFELEYADADPNATTIDSLADYPYYTACTNYTVFEYGTVRREEDLLHSKEFTSGVVVFLHGLGSTGNKTKQTLMNIKSDLQFRHVKLVFPTAPIIPYTPDDGEARHAWFDKSTKNNNSPERESTLKRAIEDLKEVIRIEMQLGVPLERIIVGGFSMGGATALHIAYKALPKKLAGVFALSSYLNVNSSLFKLMEKRGRQRKLTPLFHAHGDKDDIVPYSDGKATFDRLVKQGVNGTFLTLPNVEHRLVKSEIDELCAWIVKILPFDVVPADYYDQRTGW